MAAKQKKVPQSVLLQQDEYGIWTRIVSIVFNCHQYVVLTYSVVRSNSNEIFNKLKKKQFRKYWVSDFMQQQKKHKIIFFTILQNNFYSQV